MRNDLFALPIVPIVKYGLRGWEGWEGYDIARSAKALPKIRRINTPEIKHIDRMFRSIDGICTQMTGQIQQGPHILLRLVGPLIRLHLG